MLYVFIIYYRIFSSSSTYFPEQRCRVRPSCALSYRLPGQRRKPSGSTISPGVPKGRVTSMRTPCGVRSQAEAAVPRGYPWRRIRLRAPPAGRVQYVSAQMRGKGRNSRKMLVEPCAYGAVHGVIVRVHGAGGAQLPALPDGGGAHCQHIAPAGIIGFGCNSVCHIRKPFIGKHIKKILGGYVSGGQVIVVRLYIINKVFKHLFAH